jgi:uncharacterized protein (TIGR02271 family)
MRRVSVSRKDGVRGSGVSGRIPGRFRRKFDDGSLRMESSEALLTRPAVIRRMPAENALEEADKIVVPVIAEELALKIRRVERGKVQIHKRLETHEELIYTPTICEQVDVERIAINRLLLDDVAPEVHFENGVLIIPLVEEVLAPEKRLMLREEVRISKRRIETITPRKVVLRREVVDIVRQGCADGTPTIEQRNHLYIKE